MQSDTPPTPLDSDMEMDQLITNIFFDKLNIQLFEKEMKLIQNEKSSFQNENLSKRPPVFNRIINRILYKSNDEKSDYDKIISKYETRISNYENEIHKIKKNLTDSLKKFSKMAFSQTDPAKKEKYSNILKELNLAKSTRSMNPR